jgi:hypothetical protein
MLLLRRTLVLLNTKQHLKRQMLKEVKAGFNSTSHLFLNALNVKVSDTTADAIEN